MAWVAAAVAGGSIIGGLISADAQSGAAETAANAQMQSSAAGIAEQRRQFDALQQLLKPYVDAGQKSLFAQQNLTGLNGMSAQQTAIDALKSSPAFTSAQQLGENRILANASATGGLRGGNTQSALAQFSPALLAQMINDQYSRLGGMTSLGQNAAAGTGNAGMQSGNSITALLQQQGAAGAGAALADGRAQAGLAGSLTNGMGLFAGLGGFGRLNSSGSPLFNYTGDQWQGLSGGDYGVNF